MFQVSSPNVSDFRDILAKYKLASLKPENSMRGKGPKISCPSKKWIHSKRLQGKNRKSKAATLSFFLCPFDSFEGKSVQPRRPLENVPNIELFFQLKKSTAEVSDFARKHELAFRVLCPTKRSTFLCERSSHNASDLFAVLTGQDKCMWRRLKTLPEGCDRFWHVPRLVSMLAREQAYFTNPYDTSNQNNR